MSQHRTIPIFVPEMACPCRCVYCNQFVISGQQQMPTDEEITATIERHLATIPDGMEVELGFFGGTFTGIGKEEQLRLLRLVEPYLEKGRIGALRCSTRPDRIEKEWVGELAARGMRTIELGVQSMDRDVLLAAGRGYTPETVERAAEAILDCGVELGMQMMIGLPEDTPEKSFATAQKIINLGATNTRIYPTLVIEDTVLAKRWREGRYRALTVEEAVEWTRPVLQLMEEHDMEVLRVGLHPTEGFISGQDYLAGPFHVAFKLQVQTAIWRERLDGLPGGDKVTIYVPKGMSNAAAGYQSRNRKRLEERYQKVAFREDERLKKYEYRYE